MSQTRAIQEAKLWSIFVVIVSFRASWPTEPSNRICQQMNLAFWRWCTECRLIYTDMQVTTADIRGGIFCIGGTYNFWFLQVEIPTDGQLCWSGFGPKVWEQWMSKSWNNTSESNNNISPLLATSLTLKSLLGGSLCTTTPFHFSATVSHPWRPNG